MQKIFVAFFLLIPFFFWTLTPNYYVTPKTLLLLLLTLALAVNFFLQIAKTGTIVFPRPKLALPLLAFVGAVIANLVVSPEGRPEALAGKATFLLALSLMALLLSTFKSRSVLTKLIPLGIVAIATLLSLHSLMQLTFLPNLSFLPAFMQSRLFTPTGSFLTTLTLIIIGGGAAITLLNKAPDRQKPALLVSIILSIVASVAIISLMLPGRTLALDLIPYQETWAIALDALKSLRSGLFGVGLANFSLLYTAVKPLSLNLGPLWNTLPQAGSSELLTMLATAGILGAAALLWLIYQGLRLARTSGALGLPFFLTVLALVFTPGTVPLYVIFFTLLPLLDHTESSTLTLSPRFSLGLGVAGLLLVLLGFSYSLRPAIAEYYLRRAQLALTESDGKLVYEQHLKAIAWYPNLAVYHLSYADVNLSLASALSQKEGLTETDRQTISTLIQQAIREGKTATALRGNSSASWQTLGKIYRNLINVADGADKFAVEYYARAVALDPASPLLRVDYGGLFYQLKNYPRAKAEFQTAIQLRPVYANAYYNLSKVFETEQDYQNAYLAMQQVVANLGSDSSEYTTALSELETLKAKLPKASPSPSAVPDSEGELAIPSPLPSPLPGGPLELPAESPLPTPTP